MRRNAREKTKEAVVIIIIEDTCVNVNLMRLMGGR